MRLCLHRTNVNTIDKFSFSADGNATDVGDLTAGKYGAAGQSSAESGYVSGSSAKSNVIEKFPFATDANATDVGDLTVARSWAAGQNSAESGYASGGDDAAPAKSNVIDKFPFATDANATDVGDLTQGREFGLVNPVRNLDILLEVVHPLFLIQLISFLLQLMAMQLMLVI